jgi:hypothetical protein
VSASGSSPVLTVIGRARPAAATGAPITVTLALQPSAATFTLGPPGWVGSTEVRGAAVGLGTAVVGQATVDGTVANASCSAFNGLAAVTPRLSRTATGADLTWNAVGGAVAYRWSLRAGLDGAVVASGSTTGTSAQVTAALDAATPWLAEVGAYSFTGSETSYPSPLPIPQASFGRVGFTGGASGGDGLSAWQLFAPGDYMSGTLTVAYPNLLPGERLAVLLLNAGGSEASPATIRVIGTGQPLLGPVTPPLAAQAQGPGAPARADAGLDLSGGQAGEALVVSLREQTIARLRDGRLKRVLAAQAPGPRAAAAMLAALPATRYFCQFRYTDTSITPLWQPATLAYETAHAGFYFANDVQAGIDTAVATRTPVAPAGVTPFWGELGATFETDVYPALSTYFGPMSDVDGNGKVVFLLANLGKQNSTYPMGFFWPGDIELVAATSATCGTGSVGNRTDMLYLMDPADFTTNMGATGANYAAGLDAIVTSQYPSVMAHELQHDVNYNSRCPAGQACSVDEEVWLNEGLSMVSSTVAGYGLHGASGRADVRSYQGETFTSATSPYAGVPYYRAFGLTVWEGSPYGNYAGVAAYMQYLLDQASPAMTRALENRWLTGKANVEAATGIPWEVGFARWATAMVFSNEDQAEPNGAAGAVTSAGNQLASPIFNFLGVNYPGAPPPGDYVPWHQYTGYCTTGGVTYPKPRDAHVAWVPLAGSTGVTLRRDGWTALATGPGSGGAATLTVQSSAAVRPHVAVVKYSGALPTYTPISTTCP